MGQNIRRSVPGMRSGAAREIGIRSHISTAAIVEFFTGVLADNPGRLSKPLTNELLGLRTARRGDCRVLFTNAYNPR